MNDQVAMIQSMLNDKTAFESKARNLSTLANILLGSGVVSGILAFIVPLSSCTQQFKSCTSSGSGGYDGLGCVGGQDSGISTFFNELTTFVTVGVVLGVAAAIVRSFARTERHKAQMLELQILTIQAQSGNQN